MTYKKQNGDLSSPYTSSTFTPIIKQANFGNISSSTPVPYYGCTNTPVSYSLTTFTCSGFQCDAVYTVGTYNITWQPPAGWVQTSISANGNDVSFTPDATSSGLLTATIQLPCGYTETRTYNTGNRIALAPTFTAPNVQSCTSSASMSINPTCGAINYTYTIVGDPGVTFTASSSQLLTTNATTVNFSIAAGSSVNSIKAKANYTGSVSSSDASATLSAGVPQPGPIYTQLIDLTLGRIHVTIDAVAGAASYNWYKNGSLVSTYNGTFASIPIARDVCGVEYDISVEAVYTGCGTSSKTHANIGEPCSNYMMSPNPASSTFTVEAVDNSPASASATSSKQNSISKILLTDKMGNVIKQYNYPSLKKVSIDISGLKADTYFVRIFDGKNWISKQLSIVR